MTFAEEQGSFLVGVAAALKSETGKIGFIGGVETDLIKKFEAGYIAGAQAVNPDIEIAGAVHHAAAGLHGLQRPGEGQGDRRVDVRRRRRRRVRGGRRLRPRRGRRPPARPASPARSGSSASTATCTTSSTPALQPYVLTSMLKKVDVAVAGDHRGPRQRRVSAAVRSVFDLAAGGVDYSTSGGFVDDIADQLDDYKQQIIDGEIEVPTEP